MRGRMLAAVAMDRLERGRLRPGADDRCAPAAARRTAPGPTAVAARGAGQDLRHQSDLDGPAPVAARDRRERRHRPRRRPAAGLGDRRAQPGRLTTNIAGANGRDLSVGATASLPLFSGGRVRNSVRAANTRVEAGRADLRATEGDIFTEAVAAYMDVIRDRSIVQLNQNQVRVLETNLQATRDRFEVGDLTRTDVAQSDARLALARSSLATRRGAAPGQRGELPAGDRRASRAISQPPPPLPTAAGQSPTRRTTSRSPTMPISPRSPPRRAPPASTSRSRAAARLPTISAVSSTRYFNSLGTRRRGRRPARRHACRTAPPRPASACR